MKIDTGDYWQKSYDSLDIGFLKKGITNRLLTFKNIQIGTVVIFFGLKFKMFGKLVKLCVLAKEKMKERKIQICLDYHKTRK